MRIRRSLYVNLVFLFVSSLILILCSVQIVKSLPKIVNKVDIIDVVGLKIIREESGVDCEDVRYKLIDIPENINIINARIVHSGEAYKFLNPDNILLDSLGNVVQNLKDQSYTLVLNTKELGEIYKIINKTDYGYKVLDIKVVYNKYKNSLDISNSNVLFRDSEITVFKNDTKVGTVKIDEEGKGSIYINDIQNLSTSTYTILVKKGSEILGIDSFHITPTYKELSLNDNVKFSITSKISNKLKVCIKVESGITFNDRVQVVSVYEESTPSENLLLTLDENANVISNLDGEVTLKSSLVEGKRYKVKLRINGVEMDPQDCCDVHIKDIDISKIKVTAVEKIGRELKIDLSGIDNLDKEDSIEVISLHDVNKKDENLISQTKLTNKVNEVRLLDKIKSGGSYETLIKINGFLMNGLNVEVIPLDISNSTALTDIISNKIFICLENAKGLKVTDSVRVIGVYKEGDNERNFLKSSYNTEIEKLNGTIFLNYTLDTKNNYYVKFKINDVELENTIKITVNNDISFKGSIARTKASSQEVEVCFKNVDSINNNDVIEVQSVFDLNDEDFNLLDVNKDTKILSKKGRVYLKAAIVEDHNYGMRIKINNVEFNEIIPIFVMNDDENVKLIDGIENPIEKVKKIIDINSVEFGDGYLRFPHNLDGSIDFNSAICHTVGLESEIDKDHIIISNLVPYKKYEIINISIGNEDKNLIEFQIPEFICMESNDKIKNFISKTYMMLKNGLSNDEKKFEFADEVVFDFWHTKIKKGEIDLKKFIFEVLDEEYFFERYNDKVDRIKILYNIIFGIDPTEQSLSVWLNDLDKIVKEEDEDKSFKLVIEKMFTNLKFKSLEKQLK